MKDLVFLFLVFTASMSAFGSEQVQIKEVDFTISAEEVVACLRNIPMTADIRIRPVSCSKHADSLGLLSILQPVDFNQSVTVQKGACHVDLSVSAASVHMVFNGSYNPWKRCLKAFENPSAELLAKLQAVQIKLTGLVNESPAKAE